jgi:hypothetical protein
MPYVIPRILLFLTLMGVTAACNATSLSPGDDPRFADFTPTEVACPMDPDAFIGGDPSAYECPDYWLCEDLPAGKRCYTPGPDTPDGGDWRCWDEDGSTFCEGDHFPDDGGAGDWDCERRGEFVVCEDDTPDYPDEPGDGGWDCVYIDEFRVCSDGDGGSGDDGSGGGGSGGGGSGGGDGGGGSGGGGGGSGGGGGGGDDDFGGVCETYYVAKYDASDACEGGDGTLFCLDGIGEVLNGCGMGTLTETGDEIQIDLPSNCELISASSKCATTCEEASVDASGRDVTFHPCSDGRGSVWGISHIELMFCCD